jgi:hypothetical protein
LVVAGVAAWLAGHKLEPHQIGIFVRSGAELNRAKDCRASAGIAAKVLDDTVQLVHGKAAAAGNYSPVERE